MQPSSKRVHEHRLLIRKRASIVRAVNSILSAVEQGLSSPGVQIDFRHRKSSLELNSFFLNGWVQEMSKGKKSCAAEMIYLILRGSSNRSIGVRSFQR